MAEHRGAAAQVVVADLSAPELDPDDLHHLSRVLRLRAGAEVCATDGAGGWRRCTFTGDAELEPLTEVRREPAPPYEVGVGFAPIKGERPELVVQKLTELGVDRILLVPTRRSVVRWDAERAERNLQRLRRVARGACGQSRRLWLPTVELAALDSLDGPGTVCADMDGRPLGPDDRTVLVGPEGGWEPGEVGERETVSLGEHVLRAETAAIGAATLLCALRAALVAPSTGSGRGPGVVGNSSHRMRSKDDRE